MHRTEKIIGTPVAKAQCKKEAENKPVADEKAAEEVKEAPKAPEAKVTGNSKIAITKHQLIEVQIYNDIWQTGAEFAIKNVSDSTIATLVFEAVFYDKEGNVLDTINHRELDIKPGISRGVGLKSKIFEPKRLKSYDVKIVKMTTTDIEKVQVRKQDLGFGIGGEAQFSGTLKNISDVKTDAAVVATFFNKDKGTVGDKVVLIRDIEPEKVKQFSLKFKPQEGDVISTCNIRVVSSIEEMAEGAS